MVDKHCKYFRHEPYMTPNNYDIYFNQDEIPANIKRENVPNLTNRLQNLMPLTKKIHINLNSNPETLTESNSFKISSKLKINNTEVEFI